MATLLLTLAFSIVVRVVVWDALVGLVGGHDDDSGDSTAADYIGAMYGPRRGR